MVVIGVIGFAVASAACGFTPKGSVAAPWIIVFRVSRAPPRRSCSPPRWPSSSPRSRCASAASAMAIFFGISGGLTAIGPIAGGYLTQWTWRSIFWINIPVAIIALYLIWRSQPDDERHPAPLDYRGTVLITGGMGLLVLGLQQSASWGWSSVGTWACIVIGAVLMVAFVAERAAQPRAAAALADLPGPRVRRRQRARSASCPRCSSRSSSSPASTRRSSLGETASNAGIYILYFFIGFVIAAQIGGRILDRRGARPAVVCGSALGAVGFYLLAHKLTDLSLGAQRPYIILAGAGHGPDAGHRPAPMRSTARPPPATAR